MTWSVCRYYEGLLVTGQAGPAQYLLRPCPGYSPRLKEPDSNPNPRGVPTGALLGPAQP